jgi:hypothetical protein
MYQDFVDGARTVLTPTTTPEDEPECFVCSRKYGSAGTGMETALEFFSALPNALRETFIEHIVEPFKTPCGHTFCAYCLCFWLKQNDPATCPMCQTPVKLPWQLGQLDSDIDTIAAGVEGLAVSLHVTLAVAQEIHDILKMSPHRLYATEAPMPFMWNSDTMESDLPKVMVALAPRFCYQSKGE